MEWWTISLIHHIELIISPPRDLNPDLCPPHHTSIYTCRVTTAPRVRSGECVN